MLTTEETNFLQYLGEVSEVFKTQIENSEGKQQEIYRSLHNSVNFIVKNYQSFKDGSYENGKYRGTDAFEAFSNKEYNDVFLSKTFLSMGINLLWKLVLMGFSKKN